MRMKGKAKCLFRMDAVRFYKVKSSRKAQDIKRNITAIKFIHNIIPYFCRL